MMNRWMSVGLLGAGVLVGVGVEGLRHEPVVSAQSAWQCRSWTLESKESVDAVGPWLDTAARVEIAAAGLDRVGRYALVACKQ